tara:strand:- start:1318 stop:3723 length:2406 start_codon:yes stop_codon:yes gene_type:complete
MVTRFKLRIYLLAILVVTGMGILVHRLYSVQIVQHEEWVSQLPGEKEVTVRVPGVRGEILDRNGEVLATNEASYEVIFDLKSIIDNYKDNFENVPMTFFDAKVSGMQREKREADILHIVEETVLPKMMQIGLATDFNSRQLQIHYRSTSGIVPYTYRRDLTFEDFAMFAENDFDVPGVDVAVKPSRIYLYDSLACHLLGYVNLPDIQTVPKDKRLEFDHYVPDDYGGAGIEKSMDEYLQGKPGKRVLRRDEKGIIRNEISYESPKQGANVYLTIDAKIQYIAEQAMRNILPKEDGTSGRGAVVVMDPRNGDILAMVSVPSYNPNNFVPSVSPDDWKRYSTDRSAPMYNRALSQHAPGSTFKIPIALAGCLSDSHRRNFYCGGGVQYGAKFMKCWILSKGGRHGSINLSDAIKKSCNCYFYQYGNHTGINNIVEVTSKMGLGRKTGIPLDGEAPGLVPSPNWLKLQGQLWSDAFTAMTSIGQGFAEATPLQMAAATCTVANGGKVYQPRLIKKIVDKDGPERRKLVEKVRAGQSMDDVAQETGALRSEVETWVKRAEGKDLDEVAWNELVPDEPQLKYDLSEEGLTKDELELVKRGMYKVVNEAGGTARRAKSEDFIVSGKTGTAQSGKPSEPTNAWFISFAPYEEPELAVCVFVHNGDSGGRCGAPIAGRILKETMAMKLGKRDIALAPLKEATGHFERVLLVDFDNTGLDNFMDGDDADGLVELPEGMTPSSDGSSSSSRSTYHSPSITQTADQRGSVAQKQKVYQAKKVDKWKDVRQPVPAQRPKGVLNKLFGGKKKNR